MKKIYEKSELTFAIAWIVIYCVLQSLANPLNKMIGIESSASAIFCIIQTVTLFYFMKKNRLLKQYGICKTSIPARQFLYYIPLIILATRNLWNGVTIKFSLSGTICNIACMLCVGFVEEVIFRGFLFKAIAKDNIKTAILIGFLFVILSYRGGSLLPCIIAHSVINASSTFANETGLTVEKHIAFNLIMFAITAVYALALTKTLPKNLYFNRNGEADR